MCEASRSDEGVGMTIPRPEDEVGNLFCVVGLLLHLPDKVLNIFTRVVAILNHWPCRDGRWGSDWNDRIGRSPEGDCKLGL